jgi:hypothetical protein
MGSFDYTCAVSGLSIGGGDRVRYLLLNENPHHNPAEHACYIDGRWAPRTIPIRANYNDYGTIEDYKEDIFVKVITEQFKQDLITRGVGENQCHDIAVTRDMSFKGFLEAIWEGRVLVGHQPSGVKMKRKAPPKGVPTIRRVCKALQKAGFTVQGEFQGYLVSLQKRGFVRVRCAEFQNQIEHLEKAAKALTEYATMITVAKDLSNGGDLIVGPKPGRYEGISFAKLREDLHRPRYVAQAMIREDVWQALCNLRPMDEGGSQPLQWFKDGIRGVLAKLEEIRKADPRDAFRLDLDLRHGNEFMLYRYLQGPGVVGGITEALEVFIGLNPTAEEKEEVINTLGELAYITDVLNNVRYQWHPGSANGPQCGAWRDHKQYLQALAGVADAIVQEHEREGFYDP